jgi:hypothetical protein
MKMAEFASKGVAGTGLGLGIAGTALGLMTNGGLGNLFGGWNNAAYACSDNQPVNRYEAQMSGRIAELETEVKLRDANTYTDQKLLEMYKYFDGKIGCVESAINAQAVYNATNTATINCISNQVAQLMALTKVVIPTTSICPEPMARYNSWVAPTAPATT